MSDVTTSEIWKIVTAGWIDKDPAVDVITVVVEGPGQQQYAIACSGPKGMKSNTFITAIRAAAAGLIKACDGDMSAVGASTLDHAKFDTGKQRAN